MTGLKRVSATLLTMTMLVSFIPTSAMAAKSHWKTKGDKTYYILSSGKKATGWKKISSKWYYFNSKGVMQTGLKTIKKKDYYFSSKGAMKTGWVTIKNKLHYFSKKDGHALKNGWKTLSSKKYYFSSKGIAATGFKTIGDSTYYFNSKGAMKTGWLVKNGYTYYFNEEGIMAVGFVNIGPYDYQYYFNEQGQMLTGKQVIDGEEYNITEEGIVVPKPTYKDSDEWYWYKNAKCNVEVTYDLIRNGKQTTETAVLKDLDCAKRKATAQWHITNDTSDTIEKYVHSVTDDNGDRPFGYGWTIIKVYDLSNPVEKDH